MKTVGVFQAKTTFSALLHDIAAGETVTITKNGIPVARLVPPEADDDRPFGVARALFESGEIVVSDDFDAPLPPEFLEKFYGP